MVLHSCQHTHTAHTSLPHCVALAVILNFILRFWIYSYVFIVTSCLQIRRCWPHWKPSHCFVCVCWEQGACICNRQLHLVTAIIENVELFTKMINLHYNQSILWVMPRVQICQGLAGESKIFEEWRKLPSWNWLGHVQGIHKIWTEGDWSYSILPCDSSYWMCSCAVVQLSHKLLHICWQI